ncbi:hypothetical protein TNCV_3088531 [Trichonephila clavipes]|uniref:Uncharacterized protein n=1 Tax=Trichonephila clavipes TaxID=2585209 RepID=A0A8X6RL76_TRICX|nr:hypothetical protein TNCV_3088531 [Trichonephila clavipes]
MVREILTSAPGHDVVLPPSVKSVELYYYVWMRSVVIDFRFLLRMLMFFTITVKVNLLNSKASGMITTDREKPKEIPPSEIRVYTSRAAKARPERDVQVRQLRELKLQIGEIINSCFMTLKISLFTL